MTLSQDFFAQSNHPSTLYKVWRQDENISDVWGFRNSIYQCSRIESYLGLYSGKARKEDGGPRSQGTPPSRREVSRGQRCVHKLDREVDPCQDSKDGELLEVISSGRMTWLNRNYTAEVGGRWRREEGKSLKGMRITRKKKINRIIK